MSLGDDVIVAIRTDRTWFAECPNCGETMTMNTDIKNQWDGRTPDSKTRCLECDIRTRVGDWDMEKRFLYILYQHPDAETLG